MRYGKRPSSASPERRPATPSMVRPKSHSGRTTVDSYWSIVAVLRLRACEKIQGRPLCGDTRPSASLRLLSDVTASPRRRASHLTSSPRKSTHPGFLHRLSGWCALRAYIVFSRMCYLGAALALLTFATIEAVDARTRIDPIDPSQGPIAGGTTVTLPARRSTGCSQATGVPRPCQPSRALLPMKERPRPVPRIAG
jgi:hypothetical protein